MRRRRGSNDHEAVSMSLCSMSLCSMSLCGNNNNLCCKNQDRGKCQTLDNGSPKKR